jgi:hypothetical protein
MKHFIDHSNSSRQVKRLVGYISFFGKGAINGATITAKHYVFIQDRSQYLLERFKRKLRHDGINGRAIAISCYQHTNLLFGQALLLCFTATFTGLAIQITTIFLGIQKEGFVRLRNARKQLRLLIFRRSQKPISPHGTCWCDAHRISLRLANGEPILHRFNKRTSISHIFIFGKFYKEIT